MRSFVGGTGGVFNTLDGGALGRWSWDDAMEVQEHLQEENLLCGSLFWESLFSFWLSLRGVGVVYLAR